MNHWDLRHVVVSHGVPSVPHIKTRSAGKVCMRDRGGHKRCRLCSGVVRRRMPAINRNGQILLLLLALCAAAVAAGNRFEEGRTAVVAAELEALGFSGASIKVKRRLCLLLLAAAGNVRLGGPGS